MSASPNAEPRVRRRIGLAAALALVALTVLSATTASADDVGATARATASAVPPSSFGPYRVGRETIEVRSRTGRVRTVDVWYPADANATGKLSVYGGAMFAGMNFTARSLDRVPVAAGGPFPLVVYSHGSGGMRFVAPSFTETLASHGFVVVSADHVGDTVLDVVSGHPASYAQEPKLIASRAADVRMIVNGVLTRSTTPGDLLHGAVDPRRMGISGHSWGGLTAFAMVSGRAASDGQRIPSDGRFKAIVTMDATPSLLAPSDLAKVSVPALSIAGEDLYPGSAAFWYQTTSSSFRELRINRADHLSFVDLCFFKRVARRFPQAPAVALAIINSGADGSCYAPHLGAEQVQLLTNRYAVAFLLVHVAGDRRYASYLTPKTGAEFSFTAPELVPPGLTTVPPVVLD